MDETYIRVGGKWCYLYRAITAGGQAMDFYLSPKRNVTATKRFLTKALRSNASVGYALMRQGVPDGSRCIAKP